MTRARNLAVVVVLLVGGTALGQPPSGAPTQPTSPLMSPDGDWCSTATPMQAPCPPTDDMRMWGNADFLLGWVRGDPLPPLVTTSPPGTPRTAAGVLGQGGTTVVFGNANLNNQTRFGGRAALGYWFDSEKIIGIEGGFLGLESVSTTFANASTGTPILARPFFDATTGAPSSSLVAFPGSFTGLVRMTDTSGMLLGGNVDLRGNVYSASWVRVDALLGYQYLRYNERLNAQTLVQPTGALFVPGTVVATYDTFGTSNTFNGVDVGLRTALYHGPWSLELLTKVAAGSVSRSVIINGTQITSVPGTAPLTNVGGLLALPGNIGGQSNHVWTGVPQLGVNLGWQLTQNIRLRAGYSVLWWPSMVRTGDQIDQFITPGLIPPSTQSPSVVPHPGPTGVTGALWAQTVNFGVEVRY